MGKRFRCGTCKKYMTADEVYRSYSVQNWCSEECFRDQRKRNFSQDPARTVRKPPKRRSDDIPGSVRLGVLKRDNGSCRFCGSGARGVHLHHINYRSEGVDHSPHNLITLCGPHHHEVHSDKKYWKPLLLGVIWKYYVEGISTKVLQFERWYGDSQK